MYKIITLVTLMLVGSTLQASVNYNPSTGNYTVDKSGCLEVPRHQAPKKSTPNPSKKVSIKKK